jgi:hypothetical protein
LPHDQAEHARVDPLAAREPERDRDGVVTLQRDPEQGDEAPVAALEVERLSSGLAAHRRERRLVVPRRVVLHLQPRRRPSGGRLRTRAHHGRRRRELRLDRSPW